MMEENDTTVSFTGCLQEETGYKNIIRVVGVGGAGCNAVNNMFHVGITDVDYVICNTDIQALNSSPVPNKIQMGRHLTEGLGAGNRPEKGEESAIEAKDEINEMLDGAKMVIIAAGMGGGTGTGAAPVIAKMAKDRGILTIGMVLLPLSYEGNARKRQAIIGAQKLQSCVDSLLVIHSDRLRVMYPDASVEEGFKKGDEVLTIAAKALVEIITVTGLVNVDFADLKTALKDSGVAIIGTSTAAGEDRAMKAVQGAVTSPLLNNNNISGSKYIVCNIFGSRTQNPVKMSELDVILTFLRQTANRVDNDDTLMYGTGFDESLGDEIRVTVVATGFAETAFGQTTNRPAEKTTIVITPEGHIENGLNDQPSVVLPSKPQDDVDVLVNNIFNGNPTQGPMNNGYDISRLAEPVTLPFESLRQEENISEIENVPAYKRRATRR